MKKLEALAKEGKINEDASIKDSHSIIINASVDTVWGIIRDAKKWSEWNGDIKDVNVPGELTEGTEFAWTFDGTKYNATVQALDDKGHTLSITGKSSWIKSVHVWQLENDDTQTIATLSASLERTFAVLMNKHQKVHNDLLNWLERLKELAEK